MNTRAEAPRYRPGGLLLQWHITERCNLRCAHCYQDSFSGDEPGFEGLMAILDQFKSMLASWNNPDDNDNPDGDGNGADDADAHSYEHERKCVNGQRNEKGKGSENELSAIRGHITVTGGEPFIRTDFMELLRVFASHKDLFSFAVLTNGSCIDKATARRLGELKPSFVQVSMEGGRETHDRIRGFGSFERAVSGVRRLVREGVRTYISFTAHRDNYREFPIVAETARRLKADRVWADRYIPPPMDRADSPASGLAASGAAIHAGAPASIIARPPDASHSPFAAPAGSAPQPLTPSETLHFFRIMRDARPKGWRRLLGRTEIAMHRGLQFLAAGGIPYRCTAGDTLITIQPNGDLYPCRRMPIKVGNVFESHLAELYRTSDVFQSLRNPDRISRGCERCFFAGTCRGGLKCLSYALTGSPFDADPGCPLALTSGTQ